MSMTMLGESYAYADCNMIKMRSLDLALNLKIKEKCEADRLNASTQQYEQNIFSPQKEEESNIEVMPYFEGPHNENEEQETTPDGLGVGVTLGI